MDRQIQKKNNISVEGNLTAPETLIFANGFGTEKTAWNAVKEAFSADYRLVLYDNVGAGSADPEAYSPKKYHSLNAYADDMLDIIEALDLQGSTIIAHSVSSMIATIAENKKPNYFKKMIFIGASPRYLNEESVGYIGGFNQLDLDNLYEAMTSNYYAWVSGFSAMAMANPDKKELGEQFAATLSAIRPDIALAVSKIIYESDVRSELPKLHKEVLLLQTQQDIAVPSAVAQYLNQHIAGSKLEYLDATGHFPHISAPNEVIKHVKAFI